ncbi:hypothetical protein VKT23_014219 [Stygiomarasmius scandens]|uniref:F-box domain-containing protein n=1 Tax=Marasmiellus scandens TaxID=2682957 RepID=A0ABR1J3L7_9AGAR
MRTTGIADFPTEILQTIIDAIIEPNPLYRYNAGDQTHNALFVKIDSRLYNVNFDYFWNPIYAMSMVNRRFRQICLPALFGHVHLALHEDYLDDSEETDQSETERFSSVLGRHPHLAQFVRHVLLTCADRYNHQQLVINILAKFPNLKLVEISSHVGDWRSEMSTVVEAANRHPCPSLQIVYLGASETTEIARHPPTISLSRIAVATWDNRYDVSQHLTKGLHILELLWPRGSWYTKTYPGLQNVSYWNEYISPGDFCDFLVRHPMLKKVIPGQTATSSWNAQTPWGQKLLAALEPHPCVISSDNTIVQVRKDEWHFLSIVLKFKIAHASSIVDILSKINLPHVEDLSLDLEDEDNCITDAELVRNWMVILQEIMLINAIKDTLPLDNLIPRNCPRLEVFHLPEIIFRCISRRPYPTQSAESADDAITQLDLRPFCEDFSFTLCQSLKNLRYVFYRIPRGDIVIAKYSLGRRQVGNPDCPGGVKVRVKIERGLARNLLFADLKWYQAMTG